jgi:hypothetical protein
MSNEQHTVAHQRTEKPPAVIILGENIGVPLD